MSSHSKEEKPEPANPAVPSSNAGTSEQVTSTKRSAADDELQFISSNPVKKRRPIAQKRLEMTQPPDTLALPLSNTQQNVTRLRAHVDMARPSAMSSQTPAIDQQQTTASSQVPERCRSLAPASEATRPAPNPPLESRGASLPVLENFAFPQSSAPQPIRPTPSSEAVSPKQLPQGPPSSLGADARNQSVAPTPDVPSQNSVTLNQISCLDVNGVPTNTPGFELGPIFSANGSVISGSGMGNMRSSEAVPAPPLGPAMPPFNPMASPNAIPFTMYSTGNIVTIPQMQHCMSPLPASFPPGAMQPPPQHGRVSIPGNQTQTQTTMQPAVPGLPHGAHTHTTHGRSSSPHPAYRPPCLHCERIRQENLLRRAHGSPRLPASADPRHLPEGQGQSSQHSSLSPTSSHVRHPTPAEQPGPTPRSTPAFRQPAQEHSQFQHRWPAPPAPPVSLGLSPSRSIVQDIADTVRASFPYVQVAARHGMTPAKVAELLSRILVPTTVM
ncbi:uncharacterized protein B0T15DRAFT_183077 [Chaetomium strumarium]|uniref:Uncharacterized protein n=1 Tax=Chaetomium strumarium TaxID=1170767 RepID=A0AAJ0M3F8_9PEZI|nr:hypothetical protein B0T15DRAFT_183077 [Chaetomium strumarium]